MSVPRILMLPGWTQSASIYRGRMGAVRKAIGDKAELVFVDPTHLIDMPTVSAADFDSSATGAAAGAPEDLPRGWWFAEREEGFRRFRGVEPTLEYLRKVLVEQGPFQGVWGFSQGGACAAILASLIADPSQHPIFAAPGPNWPPPPLQLAVIVGGFLPLDPMCNALFEKKVPTPSLHVVGRGDTIVGHDRSLPLVERFVDGRLEWHDGGHHTPSKQSWRRFFEAYVTSASLGPAALAAIPSPSGGGAAAAHAADGAKL